MNEQKPMTSILKMVQDPATEQVKMSLAFDPSPADLEGKELPASYQLMIDVASGLHSAIMTAQQLVQEDEAAVKIDFDPGKTTMTH